MIAPWACVPERSDRRKLEREREREREREDVKVNLGRRKEREQERERQSSDSEVWNEIWINSKMVARELPQGGLKASWNHLWWQLLVPVC